MRIGLLAAETNGKSSYLTGLYGVLMHVRNRDLAYPATYSLIDDAQRLQLNREFEALVDEELPVVRRFPRRTGKPLDEYRLKITDRSTGFEGQVSVLDIPGEFVRGMRAGASDEDKSNYKSLIDALTSCDAFIVMLDVTTVLRSGFASHSKLSTDDIIALVSSAVNRTEGPLAQFGVPIVFCLTKIDRLARLHPAPGEQAKALEKAYQKVRELFPACFSPEYKHPVMITGVSIGEAIDPNPDLGDERLGGAFEPVALEIPFEYCLSFGILSAAKAAKTETAKWTELRRKEQGKLGEVQSAGAVVSLAIWLTDPGNGWLESPTDRWKREVAATEEILAKARATQVNYEVLANKLLVVLREAEQDLNIFVAGRKHEFDPLNTSDSPLRPVT